MKSIRVIVWYLLAVIVAGMALTPPVFLLLHSFGGGWAEIPFSRVFNRVCMVAALGGLWPVARALGVRRWADVGIVWRTGWRREVSAGFAWGAASLAVAGAVLVVIGGRAWDPDATVARLAWSLPKFALTALVVGVVEEVAFRGCIQNALSREMRPAGAVVLTSAGYALAHVFQPKGVTVPAELVGWASGFDHLVAVVANASAREGFAAGMLTLFLAGMVAGLTVVRTRAVYVAIGLHAGWVFVLKLYSLATETAWRGGAWEQGRLLESPVAWGVMATLGVVLWWRLARCPGRDQS